MSTSKPGKEMAQFEADLLQSVREMKAGIAGRVTRVALTPQTARRIALGELKEFDAAKYLRDEATIEEYLTAIRRDGDPRLLETAEQDVARARAANAKRHELK